MARERIPGKDDADKLYERYVKPLEQEHPGKYVTVKLSGDTIISPTLLEALQQADARFGPRRSVTFKVGAKVVGNIR
jgi:hypothetical protein